MTSSIGSGLRGWWLSASGVLTLRGGIPSAARPSSPAVGGRVGHVAALAFAISRTASIWIGLLSSR